MNPVACEDPAKLGPKVSCLSLLTPNTWVLAKWTQYITNTLTSRPKHLCLDERAVVSPEKLVTSLIDTGVPVWCQEQSRDIAWDNPSVPLEITIFVRHVEI